MWCDVASTRRGKGEVEESEVLQASSCVSEHRVIHACDCKAGGMICQQGGARRKKVRESEREISEQGSDESGARYKRRVYRARSEIVSMGGFKYKCR